MCDWLIIAILLAAAFSLCAAVIIQAQASWPLRIIHIFVCLTTAVAAALTTFNYDYFPNSNTQFRGWPVPYIIYQRENGDAPWLDFVGATLFFAYPINLVIYVSLPSLVLLILHYWLRQRPAKNTPPPTTNLPT